MLTPIADFRSGSRLEIVICLLNEEKRIGKVIEHYKDDFDVVLLDDGSTDKTLEIAKKNNVSIFSRKKGPYLGEEFFAYYANNETLSGFSFYLFADEYVNRTELLALYPLLRAGGVTIVGRRVDWCYGFRVNWMSSTLARGVVKGDAVYSTANLHEGLICKPGLERVYIEIQHLQIWDMRAFLGRVGVYAYIETERFYSQDFSVWKFTKRFVLFELLNLPRRLWSQRKASFAFQLWQVFVALLMPIVGFLCLLEQKYLLNPEDQLKRYQAFYDAK